MNGTRRRCLTAGITLVTATAMGVGPIAPPAQALPGIRVASPAVQLAARPFDAYAELFEPVAVATIPILEALSANAELLGAAVAAGEPIDEAIERFVVQPARNVADGVTEGVIDFMLGGPNRIDDIAILAWVVAPVYMASWFAAALTLGLSIGVVASTADQGRLVFRDLSDAVSAQDWLDVAYVLAEAPARLAHGALWGGPNSVGLLSLPASFGPAIARWLAPGVLQDLQLARSTGQLTADAIPSDLPNGSPFNLFDRVFETYVEIAQTTTAHAEALLDRLTENPAPIPQQPLVNLGSPEQLGPGLVDAAEVLANQLNPTNPAGRPAQFLPPIGALVDEGVAPSADEGSGAEPDAGVKADGSLITDLAKIDAAKEWDSKKSEDGDGDKDPRKSDRPEPFKKIRDGIRETVTDLRNRAKSAADRHNDNRTKMSSSTKDSKNDSASNSNAGSKGGSTADPD